MAGLITNKMHWAWKVTFVPSVIWLMFFLAISFTEGEPLALLVGLGPIGLWVTARWLSLGKD